MTVKNYMCYKGNTKMCIQWEYRNIEKMPTKLQKFKEMLSLLTLIT